MRIIFEYGKTWTAAELPPNSIALDGAVQAPSVDTINRRYSFDHHAGCLRFATLASCQQVALALRMGLDPTEFTVYINDLDADTMAAVWCLLHPERVTDARVVELVKAVGEMDANYVGRALDIHKLIMPIRGQVQTHEHVTRFLEILDTWWEGGKLPPVPKQPPGRAFGWTPQGGWVDLGAEALEDFAALYDRGFTAAVMYNEAQEGTLLYTVAKRSDFVSLPIGPGHVNRQSDPASYRQDTILGQLALAEIAKNPGQAHATNWGGGTTIGGSCRNPGNVGSRLTPAEVLKICRKF